MSKVLSKSEILECQDLVTEQIEIPQWGGSVYVRSMTAKERDDFEGSCLTGKGKHREVNMANMRAKLVALSTVDASGNRIFDESDIAALSKKNAGALDLIFATAQRLSGIGDQDVEALTKNIEPDQS